jgi:thioredoxin 1
MAIEVTSANFDQLLKSGKPLVVDFWAGWCGPCRMIAPLIEEFAGEYDGRILIGKCDVDSQRELAVKYSIRSIPALLFFKDGEPFLFLSRDGKEKTNRFVGAATRSQLKSLLEAMLV